MPELARRVAIAVCAALLLAPPALAKGTANLDQSLKATVALKKLEAFRSKVRTLASQGKQPVVVFDIDDTLVRVFTKKAVPGASAFVNGLLADGAKLIYQTGRKDTFFP